MTKRKQMPPHLTTLPMLPAEAIYIGVDIGKFKPVAGFVSKTLLERHKHLNYVTRVSYTIFRASAAGKWSRADLDRVRSVAVAHVRSRGPVSLVGEGAPSLLSR